MIKVCVLGSGSKGNSVFINLDGMPILIDCGFSKKELNKRLATVGRTVDDISYVFITHDHGDHIAPWVKREGFWQYPSLRLPGCRLDNLGFIESFHLSHDSHSAAVGYSLKDKAGNKLTIILDTGCIPEEALPFLMGCKVVLIETNYDVELLAGGKYPTELLERIASDKGHLRNECAAEAVGMTAGPELQYVFCMHLSEAHNRPDFAKFCIESEVTDVEVIVSSQTEPSKMVTII